MTEPRPARWAPRRVLPVILALAAGFVAWLAAALVLGGYHLASARSTVDAMELQVDSGDTAGVADSVLDLQRQVARADRWLGGLPWTLLKPLPVVGDTIAAATTLTSAADSIVEPLAPAAAAVAGSGQQDMAGLAAVLQEQSPGFIAAGQAAQSVAPEVAAIDSEDLIGPLAGPLTSAQEKFEGAARGATGLAAASVLLPGMFGIDGPTQWAVVASQPAEARGSGAGFFGAFGIMEADGGRLHLASSEPNNAVYDLPADLSVLPAEFEQLWGEPAAYIWGHNRTRHFPYAATLMAQTAAAAGPAPAYVVALDPVVVAALLEVTGPVTAAGVTIDADNAVEYLTSGIYEQFPTPDEKDRVALELMSAVLVALQGGADPSALISALMQPLSQQRLVAWSADPEEEQVIEPSVVGGAVSAQDVALTVALNNAAGNKLDAYLQSSVDVELSGRCGQASTGRVAVTLTMADVPADLPPYVGAFVADPDVYGANRTLVHVYGPPGAELKSFTIDGEQALSQQGAELGRPVWGTPVELPPDTPVRVEVTFAGTWGDDPLMFSSQPMIQPTEVTLRDAREC